MHAQVTYACKIQHAAENLRYLKILLSKTADIHARNMKGERRGKGLDNMSKDENTILEANV